jgi:hypothetical protein
MLPKALSVTSFFASGAPHLQGVFKMPPQQTAPIADRRAEGSGMAK